MKKNLTITIDQTAVLRRMPSELVKVAMYRSGAGVHRDQGGRYGKRERAQHKQDERRALHGGDQ